MCVKRRHNQPLFFQHPLPSESSTSTPHGFGHLEHVLLAGAQWGSSMNSAESYSILQQDEEERVGRDEEPCRDIMLSI